MGRRVAWPCSDGLVPVSIAALGPTPELGASDLDRFVLHITRLLAENGERAGEVAVLGRDAVDAELRDASVGVEGGDAGASLCCREEVQPAAAVDAAGDDEALDAELIEGSSDQRKSFGERGSDVVGPVRVARCRRRAPQPPGHVLFGEPFDGGGVGAGVVGRAGDLVAEVDDRAGIVRGGGGPAVSRGSVRSLLEGTPCRPRER